MTGTAEAGGPRLLPRLIVLVVAALAAWACGGAGGARPGPPPAEPARVASPEALAAVRSAVAGTLSGAATISMTLTGATVFDGSPSRAVATGQFDFRSSEGVVSLSTSAGQRERVVFTPLAVYIQPPAAGELLPAGKSWIADHFSDTPALAANFPQFVAQVESVNPGFALSQLAWGATAAAAAGEDTVQGRRAARYDVTVDLSRALAGATGAARGPFSLALESEIAALDGSAPGGPAAPGTPAIEVRVWVTDAGRLVQLELRPPGTGLGAATITLSGVAGTVRADPPAANAVVELSSLTPSGERENRNGGDSDGG